MTMRPLALIVLLAALALPAWAVQPGEMLKDAKLEARARTISQELRCMVCQNQSIDDSDAPLAHDLRMLVRQRLEQGDSDKQVVDFIVARYGDFVLLKPPFELDTLLLWGLPPAALIAGLIALVIAARRRRDGPAQPPLTAAEQDRLSHLVDGGP
jgi:cytochrome c-type biogenesis protein CcmH